MNWPWRTIARHREHLLGVRISDLEKLLAAAAEREKYFRDRYERLADLMLVRQVNPTAVAPVHVEPHEPAGSVSLGARVGRVAQAVGSSRGITFEPHKKTNGSGSEIPALP